MILWHEAKHLPPKPGDFLYDEKAKFLVWFEDSTEPFIGIYNHLKGYWETNRPHHILTNEVVFWSEINTPRRKVFRGEGR
jgi:hypothetical protein